MDSQFVPSRATAFQAQPRMPVPAHTGQFATHLQAKETLGTAEVRASVRKPPGVHKDDWIASQTLSIFEEVGQLVLVLEDLCTLECCPRMSAGKHIHYSWADEHNPEPQQMAACDYMRMLVAYAEDKLHDPALIPVDGKPFPRTFQSTMGMLLKRFFRVYAHAYVNHFDTIKSHGAEAHMNFGFKHFLFFVLEFDLVSRSDMGPLDDLIQKFLSQADEWDSTKVEADAYGTAGPEEANVHNPPTPTHRRHIHGYGAERMRRA